MYHFIIKTFNDFIFNKYSTQKSFYLEKLVEFLLEDSFLQVILKFNTRQSLAILELFFNDQTYSKIEQSHSINSFCRERFDMGFFDFLIHQLTTKDMSKVSEVSFSLLRFTFD